VKPVQETAEVRPSWYRWYVLAVLGAIAILNYYDRNLISILVDPIKKDLSLSDSDMGLLAGFGFALMYSLLGIPMARWADVWGRSRLLGGVLAVWSLMTALSGAASSFTTMLLARVGVGIGEAGGLPASHALVADYYAPDQRGKALSTFGICGVAGVSLAMAAGGWLSDWKGWRVAFYFGGIPGIVLAGLVLLTVRDARPSSAASALESGPKIPIKATLRDFWRRKSYVQLCLGLGIALIGAYGQFVWTPAFLMRSYHLSAGQLGGLYSLVVGPAAMVPIFVGGVLNDWLMHRDPRWPLWILAACFLLSVPVNLILFMVHDFSLAMAMSFIGSALGGLWIAPSYALVQNLAGPRDRALAAAIFMMWVNIIGLGLGPSVTGILSERLTPAFGDQALGLSLCIVTGTCAAGAVCLWVATRTVAADIERAKSAGDRPLEVRPA
jgi:predicted MFS family arabinose efflux permease